MLEASGAQHAHVVVLSDGYANRGLCDPRELADHAAALAARGVTTSAVGVGRHYSSAQLEALARGGEGRLNHCDHGEDIVDVILGELMEERETIAQQLTLTIRAPRGVPLELLSELPHERLDDGLRIRLGNMGAGSMRSVALLAAPPRMDAGATVDVRLEMEWCRPGDGEAQRAEAISATLRAATAAEVDAAPRDLQVAERILDLWEASLAYRGTQLHAEERYDAARDYVGDAEDRVERFSRGTARARQRRHDRSRLSESVSSHSLGSAASRISMDVARKTLRQEKDRRRDQKGSWRDQL